MVSLSTPLQELRGIGPKFSERLKKLNIETVKNLLWHFPFRYEDFSEIKKIADLKVNERATIQGVITAVKLKRTWRRRMFIVEALISDDTGSIKAIWFNQRFLLSILKKGRLVSLAGKIISDPKEGIAISHPIYELINQGLADEDEGRESKHTGRLVPIYPETRKITSKALRYLIKPTLENLEKLDDPIPQEVLREHNFPEINSALSQIHFPSELKKARVAKKRFAFEDLLFLQLTNLRQRMRLAKEKAYSFKTDIEHIKGLLSKLPFQLTQSQKKALWEILKDLSKSQPMNRLLQGDVGSGKTIVAALAALMVAKPLDAAQGKPFDTSTRLSVNAAQGKQNAFMAPTEVLAKQHYNTFKKFFPDFEGGVGLITSSESKIFYGDGLESEVKKKDLLKKISEGEVKIVVGTHALISASSGSSKKRQNNIAFYDLAFVVIDEQHRFGVEQRARLIKNSGEEKRLMPHFLSMSATPIPRTLSLTLFGDLDLSIIDELPRGRKNIVTRIVAPGNRDKAYAFIRGQVRKGRQAFVICPRIEPQTNADNTQNYAENFPREPASSPRKSALLWETKAVKEEYEKLSKKIFPDLKMGLLHGKLKSKEKNQAMSDFKEKKIDVLVSTSVIEVGVDIPNATIMMIEGADRFGLAQLYQFRGRVGRGEHQSFCLLFTDSPAKSTYRRLHSLLEAKNGFELAEKDLEIRGPGEFLGESQTGLPDLAMKAVQNPELVKSSREAAEAILKQDPELSRHPLLRERLEKFQEKIHLE